MIFVMTLACSSGLLPLHVPSIAKNRAFLSYLNCLSAGIFLGMALIHMLPESVEIYGEWAEANEIESPFPLPYIMLFLGYMLILLIDRVIMHKIIWAHEHDKENKCVAKTQVVNEPMEVELAPQGSDAMADTDRNVYDDKVEINDPIIGTGVSEGKQTVSNTSGVILTVALSAHSIFEGLAFGLMLTFDDTWKLAIGIVIHKAAAGVSLGSIMGQTGYSKK
jgi:solute carrier family 39 (zinc transporter), member 1/2/3